MLKVYISLDPFKLTAPLFCGEYLKIQIINIFLDFWQQIYDQAAEENGIGNEFQ